jgi:hypothetical protein
MAPLTVRSLALAAVVATIALAPARLAAQGALLPVDDVAYTYIDALQARGLFRELPLIERPYTVGQVRAAIATARGRTDAATYARWLTAIETAAEKYAPEPGIDGLTVGAGVYGVAQTSGRRDLMRADDRNAVAPGVTARFHFQAGPFTAAMRAFGDRRLREDPDFTGKKDRVLAGRTEDAYLAGHWKYATVQVGRVARSWGLPNMLGLQVSPAPYSYDQLYARLGSQKIALSTIVARLDDEFTTFDPRDTTRAQRWFTAHRLGLRLGSVDVGLTETVIYGGAGRGFDPALSNPVAFLALSQYAENKQFNVAFGVDALWRAPKGMLFGGQLLLDDFQIDECELCGEPPSVGLALSAEGLPLAGGARLFANYVRVTNLTYRVERRWERYLYSGVGLGQWASDFDEVRAGVDVGPALPLPVRAYVAFRRQGEGDYLQPFPPPAQWPTWPGFLQGQTIRTFRVGASGALRLAPGVELHGDVGFNRVMDADRVVGRTVNGAEGRIRLAWEPRWRLRVPFD